MEDLRSYANGPLEKASSIQVVQDQESRNIMKKDVEVGDINGSKRQVKKIKGKMGQKYVKNESTFKMNLRSNSKRCLEVEKSSSSQSQVDKKPKIMKLKKIGPGTYIELEELIDFDTPITFGGINPFLVETVCQVLFKHMSLSDLKNARLVCKLWDSKILERLEEVSLKQIKIFAGDDDEKEFSSQIINPRIFDNFKITYIERPRQNFFDLIAPSYLKIYTKICGFDSISVKKTKLKEMIYDLAKVSKNLQVFSFDYFFYPYRSSEEYIFKFHHQELRKMNKIFFPYLHKIHIHNGSGEIDKTNYNYKMYDVLTKNSPKLKSLSIKSISITPKFVQISRENQVLSKLEELNVQLSSDVEEEMKKLLDLARDDLSLKTTSVQHLHLKKLTISFKQKHTNFSRYFSDFLASQSNSLESLSIEIRICNTTSGMGTITMPYLEKLKNLFIFINGYFIQAKHHLWTHSFHPIKFSEKYPSLKYIEVSNISKFQSIISEGIGSSNVKTIKIHDKYARFDIVDAVDFNRLSLLFPKIEDFHYPVWYLPKNGAEISWKKLKRIRLFIDDYKEGININHLEELEEIEIWSFNLNPFNKLNYKRLFDSLSNLACISTCTLKLVNFDSVSEYVVERFKSICSNCKFTRSSNSSTDTGY